MQTIGLLAILLLVLVLPFLIKIVEKELEIFLLAMGALAVTVSGRWAGGLVMEALAEPIKITIAVLAAGVAFRYLQKAIAKNINHVLKATGVQWFVFIVVTVLGLLSSVITAIVAALVLVEITGHIKLDRKTEINLVVLACFSIGMGAALTPVGEPLATLAIGKLSGEPYHAGFFFLFKSLWYYILPGIVLLGAIAAFMAGKSDSHSRGLKEDRDEDMKDVLIRTVKTYIFVMSLVLLGDGFRPLIDQYVSKIPSAGIYWINIISAVLDNATLTAAEIGPSMNLAQINSALLGLIIAGGMLIPGNIPNIISAGKLKIKSAEWARIGVPAGLAVMALYFIIPLVMGIH